MKTQLSSKIDAENTFDILKCNNNNLSRTCPVMMCNYSKHTQQNNDIYKRNFSDKKMKPTQLYRGQFDVCRKLINLDAKNSDLKVNLKNKITNFRNIRSEFIPGKGRGTDFLRNIDVDSDLKCIGHLNTSCPFKKFFPDNKCKKVCHINNEILEKPYCQLYRRDLNGNPTENYVTKCCETIQKVDKCGFRDDLCPDLSNKQLVKMNYKLKTHNIAKNCQNNKLFNRCKPMMPHREPILFQDTVDFCPKPLKVGPIRQDHFCENTWNNQTKRVAL